MHREKKIFMRVLQSALESICISFLIVRLVLMLILKKKTKLEIRIPPIHLKILSNKFAYYFQFILLLIYIYICRILTHA